MGGVAEDADPLLLGKGDPMLAAAAAGGEVVRGADHASLGHGGAMTENRGKASKQYDKSDPVHDCSVKDFSPSLDGRGRGKLQPADNAATSPHPDPPPPGGR